VDPDQEQQYYGTFATLNYVKYQPVSTAGTTGNNYQNAEDPNTALVCAMGINNHDFFLGIGTVNSHARVTHTTTAITNPRQAYTDNKWKSYGGRDVQPNATYVSRMRNADEVLYLSYLYKSIAPGEVVSFDFAHVVHQSDLSTALARLEDVQITQPTDMLSGARATLTAVLRTSGLAAPTACTFGLFATRLGDAAASWHDLAAVSNFTTAASGYLSVSTAVDATAYEDSLVEVRAVVNTTVTHLQYRQHKAFTLRNTGLQLCFLVSDRNGTYEFMRGVSDTQYVTNCSNWDSASDFTLTAVSFYLESSSGTEVSSVPIQQYAAPVALPVSVTVTPVQLSGVPVGSAVAVRAAVTSYSSGLGTTFTTSVAFAGVVRGQPTSQPSSQPSSQPTAQPSSRPTKQQPPSVAPSSAPTLPPSCGPTRPPTMPPTLAPTASPSALPSAAPTVMPTTSVPSSPPSVVLTWPPTATPTAVAEYVFTLERSLKWIRRRAESVR
jgi:hypothetical protein